MRLGRKPRPCECIGCDAVTQSKGEAKRKGWSLDQAGRSHMCADCQRARLAKLAAAK